MNQSAIDMPRPIKAKRKIGAQVAMTEDVNSVIANEDETQVRGCRMGDPIRMAHAPVVSDRFQAREQVEPGAEARESIQTQHHSNRRRGYQHRGRSKPG